MANPNVNSSSERHALLMELVKNTRAQVEQHPEEHGDANYPEEPQNPYVHTVRGK